MVRSERKQEFDPFLLFSGLSWYYVLVRPARLWHAASAGPVKCWWLSLTIPSSVWILVRVVSSMACHNDAVLMIPLQRIVKLLQTFEGMRHLSIPSPSIAQDDLH